ncbi:MAG TPA: nitroreductase family protein [Nitrolancea sp.]|jgi:nitroreductase|nr:nitroreductase family protein [Nitrolancea sp.]
MEVFDAVRTVLAVRGYQDKPVPQDVIKRVVEAGHLTASSQNGQPWHFIVVQERETLRKLGELATSGPYTADAAFAIVVLISHSRFGVSDGSRAIQSMMLTAWADGVGSNWVGFRGLDTVKPLLNIPDDMEILAIVPFGYPAKHVGRGKKNRKPAAEVISRERFGTPFA